MASLKEKSESILNDKQLNLLPENIKKDVTVLGVTGTYEGNAGVKLFETIEDMNSDETAKEGDLAIVYRNEIQNMKADTQTQYITFPETVVLSKAFTDTAYIMLRAVDSSVMFDGNIQLDKNSFRFDGFTETGMIMVSYTSSDGITYTREEFMGNSEDLTNPVDLGTLVQVENEMGEWNDSLGNFMLVTAPLFDGLFENKQYIDKNEVYQYDISTISYSNSKLNIQQSESKIITYNMLKSVINKIDNSSYIVFDICYTGDYWYVFPYYHNGASYTIYYYDYTNNKFYFTLTSKSDTYYVDSDAKIYKINKDLSNIEVILQSSLNEPILIWGANPATYNKITEVPLNSESFMIRYYDTEPNHLYDYFGILCGDGINNGQNISEISQTQSFNYEYIKKFKYMLVSTQFTALPENIYNAIAYGKNGIIEGNITKDISNLYNDTNAEIYSIVQQHYETMEPRILTDTDKTIDKNICIVPTKLDGTSLLDTSRVTDMSYLFQGCKNLRLIPQIDTSNATNMIYMFWDCNNLVTIPMIDTSHITDMLRIFQNCSSLVNVPLLDMSNATNLYGVFNNCTSLVTVPQFDTHSAETFTDMFSGCINLQDVPLYNTSSAITLSDMFSRCPSLSDDSLNNILTMCVNATKVPTTKKTLKYVGLSEGQAQKCATLSNYTAFTEAGWTTGY